MNSRLTLAAVCTLFLTFSLAAAPSPWDSWRSGYTTFEQAESLRERGHYTEALSRYERAKKSYLAVRSARPDWNQQVISDRIGECDRRIAEVKKLLSSGRHAVPAPETKAQSSATVTSSGSAVPATSAAAAETETDYYGYESREVRELKAEKKQLLSRIAASDKVIAELRQTAQRQQNLEREISNLMRDRRIAQEKYLLLEQRCKNLEQDIAKPEAKVQELQKRLVEERLTAENARKQTEQLQEENRKNENTAKENRLLRNAMEKKLQQSETEQKKLLRDLELLREKSGETSQQNRELQEKLTAAERRVAELNAERRVAELNAEAAQIAQRERKTAQENADRISRSAAEAEKKHAADDLVAAQKAVAERDQRLTERQKEVERLALRIKELEGSLRQERDAEARLRTDAAKFRTDAEVAAAENKRLSERNTDLEHDVKELSNRSAQLKQRLETRDSEDFRAATAARETSRKQEKDLLALQHELVELRHSIDALNTRNQDLERKMKGDAAETLSARNQATAAKAQLESAEKELKELRGISSKYTELQRNFEALTAENRENRALAAAAKPQEAELAKIKLRLLETERLKADLAKEQRLNEELQTEYRKLTAETRQLRTRTADLASARRRIAELEAMEKELQHLKQIQIEYEKLAKRDQELAALKITSGETESQLLTCRAQLKNSTERLEKSEKLLAEARKENQNLSLLRSRNAELSELVKTQTGELKQLNQQLAESRKQADSLRQEIQNSAKKYAKEAQQYAEEVRNASGKQASEAAEQLKTTSRQLEEVTIKLGETSRSLASSEQKIAEQRREIAELRTAAAKLTPLNDQLSRERSENQSARTDLESRITKLERRLTAAETLLESRNQELTKVRKLNQELADLNKGSSAALRDEAEKAQRERLAEEVKSLRQLNVDLSAERDRIAAELANRERGIHPLESTVKVSGSPEELASAGLAAETSGSIELALWNYRQAVEADPDFAPAHLRIGLLLLARGDHKGALPHLSAARSAKPQDLDLALKTARCQIAVKRFGNARAIVDPLLRTHPENYQVQLLSGLIDAASGMNSRAEERIITASRLAPKAPECQLELARLLTTQVNDRTSEAVDAYEKARALGAPPDPALEKSLGNLLDRRRELIRFLSGAAGEAELGGDWQGAIWYYKKLLEMKRQEFTPRLALAQLRSGSAAAARETLEFNAPSRLGMAVRTLIEVETGNETEALRTVRQVSGGEAPADWIGMKMELEKLSAKSHPSAAERMLLISLAQKKSAQ